MASGNQIWNGNCADFVNAPNIIRIMATTYLSLYPWFLVNSIISLTLKLPVILFKTKIPASIRTPPKTVIINDFRAPFLDVSFSCQ